jgi:hypothetical protein
MVSTHTSVILTRTRVNMTLTSVITTPSSVNPYAECDFYKQSVISTRIVILTRTDVIITLTTVISTRTGVIYTLRI